MVAKIIIKKEINKLVTQCNGSKFIKTTNIVIPTQVGIHLVTRWIPTCVGMTMLRDLFRTNILRLIVSWLIFLCVLLFQTPAQAFDKPIEQNYFASLRSNETNVRAGPGSQYPIKFTFKLRSLPVKVISEYDNWSEIKDYEGDTGWVSQNLVTKKRTVIIKTNKSFINLYAKPSEKSKVVLRLENDVVGDFIKCGLEYCGIKVVGKKGWVSKKEIWGIDENDISKQES
jgi:SH3-like domain-containing protein